MIKENRIWKFSGTIGRLNYALNSFLILALLYLTSATPIHLEPYVPGWLYTLLALVSFPVLIFLSIAAFANIAKRTRDIRGPNKPVWTWVLGALLPLFGLYFNFRLYFSKGNKFEEVIPVALM